MANTCKACRLPGPLRDKLAELHRRDVPLRLISEELAAAGHPVLKDAVWRHCRDHLPPPNYLDGGSGTTVEETAGMLVAAIVARAFEGWPGRAGRAAAFLRAEGLTAAADVLTADLPETMRAGILACAGSPASELMEARVLARAMRQVFGTGHAEAARALATACQEFGGDVLADALLDLVAAVESSSTPDELTQEIQKRALAAALAIPDLHERDHALRAYAEQTGDHAPYREWMNQPLKNRPGRS